MDEAIKDIIDVIKECIQNNKNIVVVFSALSGITNELSKAAEKAKDGNYIPEIIEKIINRHFTAAEAIQNSTIKKDVTTKIKARVNELKQGLIAIIRLQQLTNQSKDDILSYGEILSGYILWGLLKNEGLDIEYYTGDKLIVTDDNFGDALPNMDLTEARLKTTIKPLLEKGITPIITGFIGATPSHKITTMGQGTSDLTAAIIAYILHKCWDYDVRVCYWKDVGGYMSGDPKVIPGAKIIPKLTFPEVIESAASGAKIIHVQALYLLMEAGIPTLVKNIFNPESAGTLIETAVFNKSTVKTVILDTKISLIKIKIEMISGMLTKIFKHLKGIYIPMFSRSFSESNISLIIKSGDYEKAIKSLSAAMDGDLKGLVTEITTEKNVSIIAVVGAGMEGVPGIASRVFKAVAEKGINVLMISQGSELNISFVVKRKDGILAARAIHEAFGLNN